MTDLNPAIIISTVGLFSRQHAERGDNTIVARWFSGLVEDREHMFWTLQIGGWAFYGLIRYLNALAIGFTPDYFLQIIWVTLVAFFLTLILRYIIRFAWNYGPPAIFMTAIIMTAGASAALSALELWGLAAFYDPEWDPKGWQLLGNAFYDAALIMAWAGLYISIKFLRQYREQNERMLKVTAMAHQAQLQMLRYQLNPHFLFNTLNAISTLLLDKNSQAANRMLTKMSSFLRYTLVNQPTEKVTLDQELHALGLYLDIERVRFEDRLDVKIKASKDARNAKVPSLLLQPLIENAIKYAIAPSEDGGTICIEAELNDDTLRIILSDTGPGLPKDMPHEPSATSSGVGLVNTKERLKQIYGDDFDFRLQRNQPTGLCIQMTLPAHSKN